MNNLDRSIHLSSLFLNCGRRKPMHILSSNYNWLCKWVKWFNMQNFSRIDALLLNQKEINWNDIWEGSRCAHVTRRGEKKKSNDIELKEKVLRWALVIIYSFILWHFMKVMNKVRVQSPTNYQPRIWHYLYLVSPLSNEDCGFISFTFHLPLPFSDSARPIITCHYPSSFQSSSHSRCCLGL